MSIKKPLYNGLNLLGLGFSIYASYTAYKLLVDHLKVIEPVCPVLFSIPACTIVLICYILITISWAMALAGKQNRQAMIIFYVGFIPAFLLALGGSIGEVLEITSCPHAKAGFPKCFISFGFLIGLIIAWIFSVDLRNRKR
jgi:hypothetical protein